MSTQIINIFKNNRKFKSVKSNVSFAKIYFFGYNNVMLNLIVAPKSQDRIAENYAKRIVRYLKNEKVEYSAYFSESIEDVIANTQELNSLGESEFVVIGDDVILSEFLNSVKDLSKIKVGIIATNNTNDFASFLDLSQNPIQAIKDILQKNIESVDILVLNDKRVLNNIIIGASVVAYEKYQNYSLKNFITEKIATSKYGNSFEGIELTLDTKTSKSKKENIYELVVANGGLCKGKPVSPLSNMQDGFFNLNYSTIESQKDKKTYLQMFKKGDHIYSDFSKQFWLTNLKITNSEKQIKAIVDGKIQTFESLEIMLIEKGLKIFKKKL